MKDRSFAFTDFVYHELYAKASNSAIFRKKQIKNMSKQRKLELIMQANPTMKDLYENTSEGFWTSRNDSNKETPQKPLTPRGEVERGNKGKLQLVSILVGPILLEGKSHWIPAQHTAGMTPSNAIHFSICHRAAFGLSSTERFFNFLGPSFPR